MAADTTILDSNDVEVEGWCSRGAGIMKIMPDAIVALTFLAVVRLTQTRGTRRRGDNRGTTKTLVVVGVLHAQVEDATYCRPVSQSDGTLNFEPIHIGSHPRVAWRCVTEVGPTEWICALAGLAKFLFQTSARHCPSAT